MTTARQRAAVQAAAPEVRRLPFGTVGCALHRRHDPDPAASELHHKFPLYLQKRVWPDVDPSRPSTAHDRERVPVCGTGHSDVHLAIDALMEGAPRPIGVGRAEMAMAREAIARLDSANPTA
jgi:hypothetical protein